MSLQIIDSKKGQGKINWLNPGSIVTGAVTLLVAVILLGEFVPMIINYFGNLSTLPVVGSFFASGGLMGIILGVAIFLAFLSVLGFGAYFGGKGKRRR